MSEDFSDEDVQYKQSVHIPGIEIQSVVDGTRGTTCYSTGYQFLVSVSWKGEVRNNQDVGLISPGDILGFEPGSLVILSAPIVSGSWLLFSIDGPLLGALPIKYNLTGNLPLAEANTPLATRLLSELTTLHEAVQADAPACVFEDLFERISSSLAGNPPQNSLARESTRSDRCAARRIHKSLKAHQTGPANLDTISQETGLTRFKMIRLFKHFYGLPPCTYQLRIRLGMAHHALRRGMVPAEAAANFGFSDQSHFTRLFKRTFGLTPGRFVRMGAMG